VDDGIITGGGGEGSCYRIEQVAHLAIDDDGVQTLLAAEVLVDDGLGDAGLRGDLLDAHGLEALPREQPTTDVEQLLAALLAAHPRALAHLRPPWSACAGEELRDVALVRSVRLRNVVGGGRHTDQLFARSAGR
jgi:hypothetical protein